MKSFKRQLEPIPHTHVQFEDEFWMPRLEINRSVSIPHIHRQCEATDRISAFDLHFQRSLPAPVVLILGLTQNPKLIH